MRQKRKRGNGSLIHVPGRRMSWSAVVTVGWTPSGKPVRRARYAMTREEGERLLAQMAGGVMPPPALARKLLPESTIKSLTPTNRRHRRDIPPKIRFLVLSRDNFTCVYCGAKPPDVTLHVDHRIAYSKSGANDPANYATACSDCNLGKGDLDLEALSHDS